MIPLQQKEFLKHGFQTSRQKVTASAIGTFSGFQSICTMLASSLTGLIWFQFGATTAFTIISIMTILIIIYFGLTIPYPILERTAKKE